MISYDKQEIREVLSTENVFDLLIEWGGMPEYTNFGILSSTICHNEPGEGSRKLYYYSNTGLFKCYTGCDDTFDIFQLAIKVFHIQKHQEVDLNEAVRYVASYFGLSGSYVNDNDSQLDDWKILDNYSRIQDVEYRELSGQLKEYDKEVLSRFNYNVIIDPWIEEGISQEAINNAMIGFYPGGDQITIPHFDKDGRLVGIRGRTLCADEAARFGKYRPLFVNQQFYNHPLGMNLYNFNNSKANIKRIKHAIIFESEKSTLQYQSYFGFSNDISVACCGSNISAHQIKMLLDCGVREITIAFDRQFQEIGDKEFKHLTNNLTKIHNKYKNYVIISFIFDKNMITEYKDSPTDRGKDIFLQLFKERIIL